MWLALIALVSVSSVRIAGQIRTAAAKTPSGWKLPRTPDGQPDLQGTWTNGTITPFERPGEIAGKAFLTEDEAAALERQATERRTNASRNRRPGDVGADNEAFVDTGYKVLSTRQTSLVVDPPDGRVPILPTAERKRDFNLTSTDSYESMSPWDRCITRGPTGIFPAGYNNGYQIVQTPTHVVIVSEMIHEARIIPLEARPHVGPSVRLWTGDSRGHWEGATLVVDTTNFNDKGWITTHAGSGRLRGVPHSEALHLVEHFTRVDADTISYDMTVDDPNVYAARWKFSMPLTRNEQYQMFEYACHEGNQAIGLILRGARAQERAGAEALKEKALPLDRPLATTTHIIYAPEGDLVAPSDASELGLLSRIARVALVPFGFEADDGDPRPPTGAAVEPHEVHGDTLRAALDAFVTLDPRYEWRDMDGVFVVRTRGAWTSTRDVLNQQVRGVDWPDLDVIAAFNRVARLLYPASPHEAFEGLSRRHDRPFSVHVREGTLVDVLDAAARADGELGWAVSYGTAPDLTRFTLTLGHYGNGATLGWRERPPGATLKEPATR